MKSTALAGYALAGWVLVTALVFGGLYAWLRVLTEQGDGRQFHVLVYLLFSPVVGGAIGIPAGIAFGNHRERERPGERPSVLRLRPRSSAPSASPSEAPTAEPARGIVVTGFGQDEDRRRAREAGFDEHLAKPVDPDELRRALDGGNAG